MKIFNNYFQSSNNSIGACCCRSERWRFDRKSRRRVELHFQCTLSQSAADQLEPDVAGDVVLESVLVLVLVLEFESEGERESRAPNALPMMIDIFSEHLFLKNRDRTSRMFSSLCYLR